MPVPSSPAPCLRVVPPARPTLLSAEPANDAINVARLLDYLEALERWKAIAWASCKPDGAK